MGKQLRRLKGRGARETRAVALLCLISFAISILAWSATPGAGV